MELERRLVENPSDWEARLALAGILDEEGQWRDAIEQCESAAKSQPGQASVFFREGLIYLRHRDQSAALRTLKKARDLDPDNWRIRKQIWAIEHPEKFYETESPDYEWQKEELARERRR